MAMLVMAQHHHLQLILVDVLQHQDGVQQLVMLATDQINLNQFIHPVVLHTLVTAPRQVKHVINRISLDLVRSFAILEVQMDISPTEKPPQGGFVRFMAFL
jgi:hypothetical protein